MPVLTVSAALLLLVQGELVLGVVGDDDVDPVWTAPLCYTVVSHHLRYLSSTLSQIVQSGRSPVELLGWHDGRWSHHICTQTQLLLVVSLSRDPSLYQHS